MSVITVSIVYTEHIQVISCIIVLLNMQVYFKSSNFHLTKHAAEMLQKFAAIYSNIVIAVIGTVLVYAIKHTINTYVYSSHRGTNITQRNKHHTENTHHTEKHIRQSNRHHSEEQTSHSIKQRNRHRTEKYTPHRGAHIITNILYYFLTLL